MSLELVVARYLEDLAWIRNIPPQIRATIYDKSLSGNLPNVGREAHTYLHHICTRYDDLAPVSVFCQGKPFDHCFDFRKTLREIVQTGFDGDFRWLGHVIDTDSSDGALFKTWSKNPGGEGIDIAGFHRELFGIEGPNEYVFTLGGQFIASRELIRRRPLDFYRRALQISTDFPEAAHCFERTWDRIFGVTGVDLAAMNGAKTRYLKPVRRLEAEIVLPSQP
ncbi:MAG TPA: DUF3431 domain-containing protein [Abditibacterium sp.]